jgi:hypothetical protein
VSSGLEVPSYQFANTFGGTPVGGVSLGLEPGGGKLINFHHTGHVPCKVTGSTGINGGGSLRPEFVQSISFFFGHSCHAILQVSGKRLNRFPSEGSPRFTALHRMEYVNVPVANDIIQNFQQVCIGIKADKQVFVVLTRYGTIKNSMLKSVSDVDLGNTMLKSGLIEFYTAIHRSSILHKMTADKISSKPSFDSEYEEDKPRTSRLGFLKVLQFHAGGDAGLPFHVPPGQAFL